MRAKNLEEVTKKASQNHLYRLRFLARIYRYFLFRFCTPTLKKVVCSFQSGQKRFTKKKLHRTTCTDSDFWRAAFIDIFCSDFVHRPLKKKYLAFNLVKRITPIIQYWGLGRFIIGFDLLLHHEMCKRYLEAMSPPFGTGSARFKICYIMKCASANSGP